MPTFETGRRAGLGLDIGSIAATMSAWDSGTRPEATSFPYYYRWYFRTGTTGDFETLVRLLAPKPVDPRVGTRDMDVQMPNAIVRGVDKPELGGKLRLGGALRRARFRPPAPPDRTRRGTCRSRGRCRRTSRASSICPTITSARATPTRSSRRRCTARGMRCQKRILFAADGTPLSPDDNWVHRLNLDPRFRVAAGFGTRVVQDQQEQ